ncbi:hypothetical protein QRD86_00020 (plasmid) [Bacillus halotolerans]|uniref:thioester domain-containing protein n=1 Tax=Bacillus halotolerans TaxID=260554 RepID=UPI002570061D|nr:thioester domain-containing protein [Bacillus halotolerans]WJE41173.1 hypothetical protein QRD86_00020 [Bacillus halotolerans]
MNKRNKSLLFIFTLVCSFFFIMFSPSLMTKAQAITATAKGPYTWVGPRGIPNTTAYIEIDGKPVFCIDPDKDAPFGGQSYSSKRYYDEGVKAILYYGYGGHGNEIGNSMDDYIKTHFALVNWIHGKREKSDSYANEDSEVWKLLEHAKKKDAPTTKLSFSKNKASSSISGNVQKSESIKLNGDSKNSVKIPVPKDVTIHVGSKTQTGGTYTVKGGQSFYFTAPLSYGNDFKSGSLSGTIGTYAGLLYMPNKDIQRLMGGKLVLDPAVADGFTVDFEKRQKKITVLHKDKYEKTTLKKSVETKDIGTKYSYSPEKKITKDGKVYVPVTNEKKTGTLGNKDITITFYYVLQRKITVLHKDNRNQTLLKKEVFTKNRGDSYSYSPLNNLKKGEYTYRPISTKKITGTVGKDNITITFYYDVPLIQAKLDKLQIYTDNASKGLPVKLYLSKKLIYSMDTKGFDTAKINISLYQGENKLLTKAYTAKSLPKNIDMKIPSKGLKINENKPYTVKFEGFNSNDFDVPNKSKELTTLGYSSSEETIKLDIKKTLKGYSLSKVVMTEITPTTKMKSYYEKYNFTGQKIPVQKTGYGTEQHIDYKYENQIGVDDTKSKLIFHTPSKLVDSYLDYTQKNNQTLITMDKTKDASTKNGDVLSRETRFSYPHVNVEKETGYLFTDKQVEEKNSHITKTLIDGGRKFYTPIWADLGKYKVSYQSNNLGVNDIKVVFNDTLELNAYMYGHMDSNTKDKDEIMLTPINADDPFPNGAPKGWSSEDIAWLKK